jgi:hypothetical protein
MTTKSRFDIQSREFMCAIIWNPSGFYVVDRFPNDAKMNSAYSVTNILIPLLSSLGFVTMLSVDGVSVRRDHIFKKHHDSSPVTR